MTDEFGVPVSERLPASQAEVVRRWDAAQAERQRARAEAEEAFKRTIFDPVWAAAEERIAVERDRLSVPFVSDWVRPSVSQRMLDARIGANTSARTLDEGQARQAIEHMVQVYTAAYREFEVVSHSELVGFSWIYFDLEIVL